MIRTGWRVSIFTDDVLMFRNNSWPTGERIRARINTKTLLVEFRVSKDSWALCDLNFTSLAEAKRYAETVVRLEGA